VFFSSCEDWSINNCRRAVLALVAKLLSISDLPPVAAQSPIPVGSKPYSTLIVQSLSSGSESSSPLLQSPLSLTFEPKIQTIRPATAEQRRRGKSMSRRPGHVGTIVKEGGWYRVRFRLDVPGQYERVQKSIRICPVSGPGLLNKSERERRRVEIVNTFGANSVERFSNRGRRWRRYLSGAK